MTKSKEYRSAPCSTAFKIYYQKTLFGSPSAVFCYIILYKLLLNVTKLILTAVLFFVTYKTVPEHHIYFFKSLSNSKSKLIYDFYLGPWWSLPLFHPPVISSLIQETFQLPLDLLWLPYIWHDPELFFLQ